MYVTINDDATVTIEPYSINRGNGWEDESSLPPMVFTGRYDNGHIICNGESGDIDFYVFYEDQGVQYAIGDFDALSGDRGTIGLTRP